MTEALIVLDASIVLAWGFADEYSEYARLTFEALEHKQGVVLLRLQQVAQTLGLLFMPFPQE